MDFNFLYTKEIGLYDPKHRIGLYDPKHRIGLYDPKHLISVAIVNKVAVDTTQEMYSYPVYLPIVIVGSILMLPSSVLCGMAIYKVSLDPLFLRKRHIF